MRFNERAKLDSSQVRVRKGRGAAAATGGVGLVGLLVVLAIQFLGGDPATVAQLLEALEGQQVGGDGAVESIEGCETGADANLRRDCQVVGYVNSIQAYWTEALPGYRPAATNFFTGSVSTACGSAPGAVGPFYCPAGEPQVYIDLEAFDRMKQQLGTGDGDFVEAYVLGHEYGHHVQNLTGDLAQDRRTGPDSEAVRQELQADCYAGVWTHHATRIPDHTGQPLIVELTDQDIADAIRAASAVGDDHIQEMATGQVNPESFSHGTSEQRQHWFMAGYGSGDPNACSADVVRRSL